MKMRSVILLVIGFLLLGIAAVPFAVQRGLRSRIGPQHAFELSEPPAFLTEELALAKARDALAKEGLDHTIWQPQRYGGTFAPDGRPDEFAARNSVNSNRVVFAFTNSSALTRFVSVELSGNRVICQSSIGK